MTRAIIARFPAWFVLSVAAVIFSILVAVPLGVLAAIRRGHTADRLVGLFSLFGVSFPNFAIGPVLIFCRTKIGAERLAQRLSTMGIRAASLHADRTQQQRMAAVEGFRTGTYPVLVATDVAARGLDIDGIAHVVNYEVPDTPEAYVHRVGRTGRAESTGSALTLVAPEELRALRALEKAVGVQLQ